MKKGIEGEEKIHPSLNRNWVEKERNEGNF